MEVNDVNCPSPLTAFPEGNAGSEMEALLRPRNKACRDQVARPGQVPCYVDKGTEEQGHLLVVQRLSCREKSPTVSATVGTG